MAVWLTAQRAKKRRPRSMGKEQDELRYWLKEFGCENVYETLVPMPLLFFI